MRWPRIVLGSLLAEFLPIVALVAVVVAFGPHQTEGDRIFAEQTGRWLGPIAGFVATLSIGYWVARGAPSRHLRHGLAVGVGSAVTRRHDPTGDIAVL